MVVAVLDVLLECLAFFLGEQGMLLDKNLREAHNGIDRSANLVTHRSKEALLHICLLGTTEGFFPFEFCLVCLIIAHCQSIADHTLIVLAHEVDIDNHRMAVAIGHQHAHLHLCV